MPGRDIIVVGASAGGVEAIQELLSGMPQDIPAAIFVVLHLAQAYKAIPPLKGSLPFPADVFARRTCLPVHAAVDGEGFQRGHVYVAVSDEHLVLQAGVVRLENSPAETWFRPSVDVLFRSAARAYGRRVMGVVLSGLLKDGTVGLGQVKKHGGIAIVQDPLEAQYSQMPQNALNSVRVDYCLPAREIAQVLVDLAAEANPASPQEGSPPIRVLVVEDERIVAVNLERRLRKLGYEVCGSASSGEAAIRIAGNTDPDIVLMDVRLPGISGTEAAQSIWNQFQIPVVYVTAYGDAATIEKIKTNEPHGYVLKPFRPAEIDAAIKLALDRRDKETRQ